MPSDMTRVLFVGDIEMGGDFAKLYCGSLPDCTSPFSGVQPLFSQADLIVGNLESPLAKSDIPSIKRNQLHAPSEAVNFLNYLGVTALCLANNHITDQGVDGVINTRALLTNHGIKCFGAGQSIKTAAQPALNCHKEQTFGLLGYAVSGEDVGAVIAGESKYGCAPFVIDSVERHVRILRDKVSHVIVSLHWGYQYDLYPYPEQISMARRIIDAGALIVHGHHPHVVQGMERYRNGLIMYSLGNFIFPDFQRTDGTRFLFPASSRRTSAVMCEIDASGVRAHSAYPLRVTSSYRVKPSRGITRIWDEKSLSRRSKALSKIGYEQCWEKFHAKTRRVRRRQERLDQIRIKLRGTRDRFSSEGYVQTLKRLRGRHFIELFNVLWRYVVVLLSRRPW